MSDDAGQNLAQPWVAVVGAVLGATTLLFLMGLVLLSTAGRQVPCESRFLVIAVLGFGAALSGAFLGGSAAARGKLPIPFAREQPLWFSVSGGVAVLILVLVAGKYLYVSDGCSDGPSFELSCPDTYQSFYVQKLRFGFCYPRGGWLLDSGPIDVRAADIYVRNARNNDVGIHFHVSLIPSEWSAKHDAYSQQVANTWKQLDAGLQFDRRSIGGREAYAFSLHVKDRMNRSRPTEVWHVYLSDERLLEIISTWFEDTDVADREVLERIRSSLFLQR